MNGLKVYVAPDEVDTKGHRRVFYSCREGGPSYLWRYEEGIGQWHFSRLHPSGLMSKSLCLVKWSDVPKTLQARLSEHYLE